MNKKTYRRAFQEAQAELARTIAKRDECNARILQLKQAIRNLGDLLEEDPDQIEAIVNADEGGKPSGITRAVRAAFQFGKANNYPRALTIGNLKDLMTERGFDFTGQANPIASLTTVVHRLKDKDEVDEFTGSNGKKAYVWKGAAPTVLACPQTHCDKTVGRAESGDDN